MIPSAIMQGFPVPPQSRVPRADWDRAPWNRWSFQHVRQILPTVGVPAKRGAAWVLGNRSAPLGGLSFGTVEGGESTISRWLDTSYTDGFLVLHDGDVVMEKYANGMRRDTLHLSQSVAKSVTATVAGILIGRSLLDPSRLVSDYLPELAHTGWQGATLRHVLDMTSGVRYIEDYEALDSDIAVTDVASGWKPPTPGLEYPDCIWDQILGLTVADRPHGQYFQYRSIETDVLAHCMERVTGTRLAELVSRELWKPMGAERDACFTVDSAGYALADGGFNACLRDYARFGQLHLAGGFANRRQIVPGEWIDDILNADPSLFHDPYTQASPLGAYRNQFWVHDSHRGIYMARGVFGQLVYIDRSHNMVAVKLSSWPEFVSTNRLIDTLQALECIGRALNGGTQ